MSVNQLIIKQCTSEFLGTLAVENNARLLNGSSDGSQATMPCDTESQHVGCFNIVC